VALLQIVAPVTFVLGAINMYVNSKAVCLVVFPVTLVHIAVSMPEFTFAVRFVILPFTLVSSTVWPDLGSWAVPGAVL